LHRTKKSTKNLIKNTKKQLVSETKGNLVGVRRKTNSYMISTWRNRILAVGDNAVGQGLSLPFRGVIVKARLGLSDQRV
jgi:hypothetical protein